RQPSLGAGRRDRRDRGRGAAGQTRPRRGAQPSRAGGAGARVSGAPSCARCGAPLEPGQEYCLECGARETPRERPRWGPPLLGATVALAVAVIVIALVY